MTGWRVLAAAIAIGLSGASAPAATVCRPTELGTTRCTGPAVRPQPRRIHESDARGLDQVLRAADPDDDRPRLVPARETNRLGITLTDEPVLGPCRPDQLGNLRCR
jgi:hypothetical protein